MLLQVAAAVGPRPPLLQDPGGQTRRRVVQPVPDRLRLRRLDRAVAPLHIAPSLVIREVRPLGLRQRSGTLAGVRLDIQIGQVHTDHRSRVVERHIGGDAGSEVAALRAVPLVPEALHQLMPQAGDVPARHAGARRALREAVPRQRWDHDVERRPRDPVRRRLGQQRHERQQFDEAAWPAVRQDQRDPVAAGRPLVDEVDPYAVDLGPKLRVLRSAPAPGPASRTHPPSTPAAPADSPGSVPCAQPHPRDRVGPAGVADAGPKVGQHRLLHVDLERGDIQSTDHDLEV